MCLHPNKCRDSTSWEHLQREKLASSPVCNHFSEMAKGISKMEQHYYERRTDERRKPATTFMGINELRAYCFSFHDLGIPLGWLSRQWFFSPPPNWLHSLLSAMCFQKMILPLSAPLSPWMITGEAVVLPHHMVVLGIVDWLRKLQSLWMHKDRTHSVWCRFTSE